MEFKTFESFFENKKDYRAVLTEENIRELTIIRMRFDKEARQPHLGGGK